MTAIKSTTLGIESWAATNCANVLIYVTTMVELDIYKLYIKTHNYAPMLAVGPPPLFMSNNYNQLKIF